MIENTNQRENGKASSVVEFSDAKRRLLEKYRSGDAGNTRPSASWLGPRPVVETPLSFSQQQVWLHAQMAGDVPFYNETMTVYRQGPLDPAVVEKCLLAIIRRHEIWRTTFDIVAGEPIQTVHPAPSSFSLPVVDLRRLPLEEREAEAKRLATTDARLPFDVKSGPLLRALLVRMEDEEHRLYVTLHQIIFDAVSAYRVFVPELVELYEAFSTGNDSPLVDLSIQYADFA